MSRNHTDTQNSILLSEEYTLCSIAILIDVFLIYQILKYSKNKMLLTIVIFSLLTNISEICFVANEENIRENAVE